MQWMTITSSVACYALRVPQHVVVSPFELLNQINACFRLLCRNSICTSELGISRHIGFSWYFCCGSLLPVLVSEFR